MPPEPLTLGFDTSAAHVAAALLSGDRIIGQHDCAMSKGQAENLIPILETLLADAKISWADLDRIGVGVGPGNFTGTRIAVSAARGLALALDIPAIGVNGFEVAAFGAPGRCRALVDAPRDQVYMCDTTRTEKPLLMPRAELPESPLPTVSFSGLAAREIAARIARIAAKATPGTRPAPLYIRDADAAPPRDPAPAIIG